jgi:hypothetical protein
MLLFVVVSFRFHIFFNINNTVIIIIIFLYHVESNIKTVFYSSLFNSFYERVLEIPPNEDRFFNYHVVHSTF